MLSPRVVSCSLSDSCASFHFMQRDMQTLAWHENAHSNAFCASLSAASSGNDRVVVFSHGVGTLVVASALARETCSLGESVKWYSAAAPLDGSEAANKASLVCLHHGGLQSALDPLGVCKREIIRIGALQFPVWTARTTFTASVRGAGAGTVFIAIVCIRSHLVVYTGPPEHKFLVPVRRAAGLRRRFDRALQRGRGDVWALCHRPGDGEWARPACTRPVSVR